MSQDRRINMQHIDHYVFVMVNDIKERSSLLKCLTCMSHNSVRLVNPTKFLDSEYFVVQKHSDLIDGKHKYEHLIDSIHLDLYQDEYGLLSYIRNSIPISTFTIFINGQNSYPYYPFCIATVDISNIDGDKYMYINGLSGSSVFRNCASHMMRCIKMIAWTYNCLEIRFRCDEYVPRTIKWYKQQGFKEIDQNEILEEGLYHNYVYNVRESDRFYKRAVIAGQVRAVIEESEDE